MHTILILKYCRGYFNIVDCDWRFLISLLVKGLHLRKQESNLGIEIIIKVSKKKVGQNKHLGSV